MRVTALLDPPQNDQQNEPPPLPAATWRQFVPLILGGLLFAGVGVTLIAFYGGLGVPVLLLATIILAALVNVVRACRDVAGDPFWTRLRELQTDTALREIQREERRHARRAGRGVRGGVRLSGGQISVEHVALMLREGNFSANDYDVLLALDSEANFTHMLQGASIQEVSTLPTYKFKAPIGSSSGRNRAAPAGETAAASDAASASSSSSRPGRAALRRSVATAISSAAIPPAAAATGVGVGVECPREGAAASALASGSSRVPLKRSPSDRDAVSVVASDVVDGVQHRTPRSSPRSSIEPPSASLLECSICLERYSPGDELRMLPCMHSYHDACITPWLMIKATCPVCKGRRARESVL